MKYTSEKKYKAYLDRAKVEDVYRGGDELFWMCRQSDLKDIRKIYGIKVKPLKGKKNMESQSYYGLEDAVRSVYVKGGKMYYTDLDLRLENPNGDLYVFHRVEKHLLPLIDDIKLDYMELTNDDASVASRRNLYRPEL